MYDFCPVSATSGSSAAPPSRTSTIFPPCLNSEPYGDLFTKWGLLQPGEWSLRAYHYTHSSTSPNGTADTATTAAAASHTESGSSLSKATVPAAALRFHHGMAKDFLCHLFASPLVLKQLQAAGAVVSDVTAGLHFRPLTCHWTTLEPLRKALVAAKVVRQVGCAQTSTERCNEREEEGLKEGGEARLPTVKCAEVLLPHGEVISDELRALFLQAHSRQSAYGSGSIGTAIDDGNSNVEEYDNDEDDDEDVWAAMSFGAKMPLRQLRAVFDQRHRSEFLYHLVWRLVAGSGPLNQFEDDAAVYLSAACQLYRAVLTSFHVREAAVSAEKKEEEEGDVTVLEAPSATKVPSDTTQYEAVVDACVYEVLSVPQLQLFPSHDGVTPSNLNYCYVVVNPSEQTVCVWYHCCK